jgi:hypothetical protein
MKKLFTIASCVICFFVQAQEQESLTPKGFDRNRMFIGSGLNLGISNRSFNIGLNPEIGYRLTNWLDAGVAINFNYFSQSAELNGIRYRNFNYGGGGFLRAWPVNFLYVQVQPEYNWVSSSQFAPSINQSFQYSLQAPSFLAGIGYGSRQVGSRLSYFSIMIDLMQELNSPYRDNFGDPLPVFRAGFGVYLKPKR